MATKARDSQKSLVSPRLLTNINEGMGVVGGGGGLWGMGEIVLFCIGFFFFLSKKFY